MAAVGWLVKEAMSTLSSSGAVVSVPVSASSVVSSIERVCSDPVVDGSVHETGRYAFFLGRCV